MTYVVTETCIKCKYTDCVEVCPVDCFVEGPNFLAIDPNECITAPFVSQNVRWRRFSPRPMCRKIKRSVSS